MLCLLHLSILRQMLLVGQAERGLHRWAHQSCVCRHLTSTTVYLPALERQGPANLSGAKGQGKQQGRETLRFRSVRYNFSLLETIESLILQFAVARLKLLVNQNWLPKCRNVQVLLRKRGGGGLPISIFFSCFEYCLVKMCHISYPSAWFCYFSSRSEAEVVSEIVISS